MYLEYSLTQALDDNPEQISIVIPSKMTKYQDKCAAQFKHCAFMCGRLCVMNHGEMGLPKIDDNDICLIGKIYREIKTASLEMQQLYYKSIVLHRKLDM